MRCLALALEWSATGGEAVFCGRIESDFLRRQIESAGFRMLDTGPEIDDTLDVLGRHDLAGSWLVLDGYHFGPEWQERLVEEGYRVVALDDGARLPRYAANVILAPEHEASPVRYSASPSTVILAGSRYRLMRPGFSGCHSKVPRPDTGAVLLVSFGGADTCNATRDTVLGLDHVLGPEDLVLIILGPVNPNEALVLEALRQVGFRHELHRSVADMAGMYARADLAISAGGGGAWELAATGVPAILVPVAENQKPGTAHLVASGAAVNLDSPDQIRSDAFPHLVRQLLAVEPRLREMAARAMKVCDGKGAARVCRIIRNLEDPAGSIEAHLRLAEPGDMEQVFLLASDPAVRENSFSPEPIALREHEKWFASRVGSPATAFYVFEIDGLIVALARFDVTDDGAETDLAVHPAFRGRGLGAQILCRTAAAAATKLGVASLRAVVFEKNLSSMHSFTRGGFTNAGRQRIRNKDCVVFRWELAKAGAAPDESLRATSAFG